MLLYLLAAIADEPAVTVPPPLPASALPPHNYLKLPPATCDRSSDSGEVVVCAERDPDKRYRLQSIDEQKYVDPPVRAETKFAGGVLGITGQPTTVGGFPSNRIMLTFKIKF
jgi:hypothetical protein